MSKKAVLVLEDGSTFEGSRFGAGTTAYGEVVFDTGMTGYQEMLTDPSFSGQILVPTYPLIGNYGINECDSESGRIHVTGLAVSECCHDPSHRQSKWTLNEFLLAHGVPGITELDTRALTRRLRSSGVMMGVITSDMTVREASEALESIPRYDGSDFVRQTSTGQPYDWQPDGSADYAPSCLSEANRHDSNRGQRRIVVIDYGLKYSILRILSRLRCLITVVPCVASAQDVLSLNPDGIVLSPGPGNPQLMDDMARTVCGLIGRRPLMGICLGHQLIGKALGASTFKLKFGHRGGNHPVKDLGTGRVLITAQNHGYAIDASTLPRDLEVTQVSLNDGTVEGLRHRELPVFSMQYHCEASPGPLDTLHLIQRFVDMMRSVL